MKKEEKAEKQEKKSLIDLCLELGLTTFVEKLR